MKPAARAFLLAATIVPIAAHASFNSWGGSPCREFGCTFLILGGLLGVVGGIPFSFAVFGAMHAALHHPARSKGRQALIGACTGIVAFEAAALVAAAAAGAFRATMQHPAVGIGFFGTYVAFGLASFLYTRSAPRA